MPGTKRQRLTVAEYLFGGDRVPPTQVELARRWKISQPAVCARIRRFLAALSPVERDRYEQHARMARPGRKFRVRAASLAFAV